MNTSLLPVPPKGTTQLEAIKNMLDIVDVKYEETRNPNGNIALIYEQKIFTRRANVLLLWEFKPDGSLIKKTTLSIKE